MRTYSNRKVLKGIEGPSLENRKSIDGSHSRGNEKNRGPKRLPMGCSGSQRGLKERKRELFAGGGPGYWQKPLFAGGGPGYWQKPLFAGGGPGYWQDPLFAGGGPGYWQKPLFAGGSPAAGRTLFSLAKCPGHWRRINGTNKCAGMQQRKEVRFITNNISFKRQLC